MENRPQMSLATYLVQRGKRGIWQLRVPIPRALHAPGKPRERIKSLGTSDRRIASDRALSVLDEWKREWAAERGESTFRAVAQPASPIRMPSEHELDAIATRWGYQFMLERYERTRQEMADASEDDWRGFLERHATKLDQRARQLATGNLSAVEASASRIVEREGWQLQPDDAEFVAFKQRLATATLDAMSVERRRLAGELEAEPTSPLVRQERQRALDKAKPGETLLDLFDRYAEQRTAEDGKRSDTLTQDRKVIVQLEAFVGADRALA